MSDQRSTPRARQGGGTGLAVSAAALFTVLAAASSFGVLVEGSGWWWKAALVSTVAVAAAAVVRLRWRAWFVPALAALVAAVLTLLALFAQQTLALGFIPTGDTIAQIRYLVVSAFDHIAVETIPASPASGLDFLLASGIVAVAIVSETLAVSARAPVIAALLPLGLAVGPGRAVFSDSEMVVITVTLVFVIAMIWLDRRRDTHGGSIVAAAGVAVLALFGGVVGQTTAPDVSDAAATTGLQPVFASGGDPLVRLGDHLRRGLDVPALKYTTTSDEPVYLRVVTIDDLTGEEWTTEPLDRGAEDQRTLAAFPPPPGLSDDIAREDVTTVVDDAFAERRWLPIPYPAASVEIESPGQWSWDPDSLTAGVQDDSQYAGEYTVTSLQVEPSAEQLRDAPAVDPGTFRRYLALPDDVPAIIGDTTTQVISGSATAYDAALAIQTYLRSSDFRYDETTPEEADGDGDSFDVIAAFLAEKRGYCVHFASAMTVMAREAGIPARIAVGYQPGDRELLDPSSFSVTSHDLHSWPELYFEGIGWTRFEPTPGRGDVPDYDTQAAAAAQTTAPEAAAPTPTTSAAARDEDRGPTAGAGAGGGFGGFSWWLLLPLALVAALLVPAGSREMARRRRLRPGATASTLWTELHATAEDLGIAGPRLSPRELAAAVGQAVELSADDQRLLASWRSATERQRYGHPDAEQTPVAHSDAVRILRQLHASRSRPLRLRARLAPRSLCSGWAEGAPFRRRRVDPAL